MSEKKQCKISKYDIKDGFDSSIKVVKEKYVTYKPNVGLVLTPQLFPHKNATYTILLTAYIGDHNATLKVFVKIIASKINSLRASNGSDSQGENL